MTYHADITPLCPHVDGVRVLPGAARLGEPYVASCWIRRVGTTGLIEGLCILPDRVDRHGRPARSLARVRGVRRAISAAMQACGRYSRGDYDRRNTATTRRQLKRG